MVARGTVLPDRLRRQSAQRLAEAPARLSGDRQQTAVRVLETKWWTTRPPEHGPLPEHASATSVGVNQDRTVGAVGYQLVADPEQHWAAERIRADDLIRSERSRRVQPDRERRTTGPQSVEHSGR